MANKTRRVHFVLNPEKHPLLNEWVDRNAWVWSRVMRDHMEQMLESGAFPMDLIRSATAPTDKPLPTADLSGHVDKPQAAEPEASPQGSEEASRRYAEPSSQARIGESEKAEQQLTLEPAQPASGLVSSEPPTPDEKKAEIAERMRRSALEALQKNKF